MHRLQEFEKSQLKKGLPHFKSGDTVKVHCKIKEGNKERIQVFEGVVISRHNGGVSSSFTVRKVSHGIGVERVFPLHAPFIEKIEVATIGKVRQGRIYYLRNLSGKKARITALDTRREQGGAATRASEAASEAVAATSEEKTPEAAAPEAANANEETVEPSEKKE